MAADFIWRGQEEARQAIARMQLEAALSENESRERIAREQTSAARYATQAQLSDREKDRAVSREDIAARYGVRSNAEAERRGAIQYSTILDSINTIGNPPTKSELEAKLAASLMSDDLKNDLRAQRDRAYNAAVKNYKNSKLAADSYNKEISNEKVSPNAAVKKELFRRLHGDKNVSYDATTGIVSPLGSMPREDAPGAAITGTPSGPVTTIGQHAAAVGRQPTNQPALPTNTVPVYKTRAELDAAMAQTARQAVTPPSHVPVAGAVRMVDMAPVVDTSRPYGEQLYGLEPEFLGPPNRIHQPVSGPLRVADMVAPTVDPNEVVNLVLIMHSPDFHSGHTEAEKRSILNRARELSMAIPDSAQPQPPQPYGEQLWGLEPTRPRVRRSTTLAEDYPEYADVPGIGVRRFPVPPRVDPSSMELDELLSTVRHPDHHLRSPEVQGILLNDIVRAQSVPTPQHPEIPRFMDMSEPVNPRMYDLERPYGPPNNARIFNSMPRAHPPGTRWWGPTPGPTPGPDDEFLKLSEIAKHPNFGTLSRNDQQWILDEIGKAYTRPRTQLHTDRINFPRVSDLQTIRPEFRPPMDDYYVAPR